MKKLLFIMVLMLAACTSNETLAPVVEGWQQPNAQSHYRVAEGDTLYSIAFHYGLDFRELAKINNLSVPYAIHQGQSLNLVATAPVPLAKPAIVVKPKAVVMEHTDFAAKKIDVKPDGKKISPPPPATTVATDNPKPKIITTPVAMGRWQWPAAGPVIGNFASDSGMNKGINIAGKAGEPIKAAGNGKVVYCGSGLRGYGNLIIVKHNDEFLSAYAHNRVSLVHEGQVVKAGDVIAKMGDSEAKQVMLHFEIRQAGKPVDPLSYLPTKL